MQLQNNLISFQSKIKFVDGQTFNKLPLADSDYIGDWDEKGITKTNQGYTDTVKTCSAGGIVDGNDATMYHLDDKEFSTYSGFQKAKEAFNDKVNFNDELNSLIVGGKFHKRSAGDGYLYNKNARNLETSEELKDNLVGFFDSKDIDYSIFWGQPLNGGIAKLFYSNKNGEDTWFVNNTASVNNISDLKKLFSFIKISEKDKKDGVYINDTKLTNDEVEEINSKYKVNRWI